MNKALKSLGLFSFLLFSTLSFANKQNQTEMSVTDIINSKTQIIAYFDDEFTLRETPTNKGGYYRKVLGETPTGWYIIQDFYQQSHKKQTDPFIITGAQDLKNADPTTIEGEMIFWHQNGKKAIAVQYLNGQRDGTWTWWNTNGQIEAEENYRNNQLDGITTIWHKNGKKKSEESYLKGKLEGRSIFWNEKGEPESEIMYKNNEPAPADTSNDEADIDKKEHAPLPSI